MKNTCFRTPITKPRIILADWPDERNDNRMNNKERILAVLDSQVVDRVPVGFWFHFLNADSQNQEFNAALENPDLISKNIEGHRAYINAFKPDMVKIMSDGYFFMPKQEGWDIDSPADLGKIKPLAPDHPWIEGQVKLAAAVKPMQADTAYFYNVFSPTRSLHWILGDLMYLEFMTSAPQAMLEALEAITETLLTLSRRVVRESGMDGIYFSVSNMNAKVISDKLYSQYIKPAELHYLQELEKLTPYNILHICSNLGKKNNLDLYTDYPVKAVSWAAHLENINLAGGKQKFPDKAVLGGFAHLPGSLIHIGSKEDIMAYTRKLLSETGRQGLILGADCTVPADIPLEHLEWVREAAAEV